MIICLRRYDSVTLYYQAYYPSWPLNAADIPVPIWAREAVVYRAAAHCLAPNLVIRARLGAFHDRQDAPPLAQQPDPGRRLAHRASSSGS